MTVRDHLKRQKRISLLVFYGGSVFGGLLLLLATQAFHWLLVPAIIVFVLASLGCAYAVHGVRCPLCHARVAHVLLAPYPFMSPHAVRFCPFCGVSMDAEVEATQPPNQAMQRTAPRSDA